MGVFLVVLSSYAYYNMKNKSLIFTTFAFLAFTMASIIMLVDDMEHAQIANEHCDVVEYPCVNNSPADLLVETTLTVMIGLFAVGVFWNSKKTTRYT